MLLILNMVVMDAAVICCDLLLLYPFIPSSYSYSYLLLPIPILPLYLVAHLNL